MSLRGFHIVFVSICMLLSLFLVGWSFFWETDPSIVVNIIGVAGIVGLILAPIYAVYFLRKSADF